ncbi:hypothetical protein J0H58_17365, partial [bacterium]|nr:hypothetical protein [bacterium]
MKALRKGKAAHRPGTVAKALAELTRAKVSNRPGAHHAGEPTSRTTGVTINKFQSAPALITPGN